MRSLRCDASRARAAARSVDAGLSFLVVLELHRTDMPERRMSASPADFAHPGGILSNAGSSGSRWSHARARMR
jgi:hypothetical protein